MGYNSQHGQHCVIILFTIRRRKKQCQQRKINLHIDTLETKHISINEIQEYRK